MNDRKKMNLSNSIFSKNNVDRYILSKYNLKSSEISLIKFKNTDKQRAIYKINNQNKCYSLKKVYYSEDDLLFIYSALEWLYRFDINVPKLLKTTDSNRFVTYENIIFILSPWLDGIKCDFDNINDLRMSIKALADLHDVSKDFKPVSGSNIKNGFNNLYIQILKHFEEINRISTLSYNSLDKFSKYFNKNFENILFLSEKSLEMATLINEENLSRSLTHGDYVNKNILISQNNVSIIDFDKCKFDYTAHDIAYFLRRLLKRSSTKWNTELCITLLNEYNATVKLSQADLKYIISYICFPQKTWRLLKSYYNKDKYFSKNNRFLEEIKPIKKEKINQKELEKLFIRSFSLISYQVNFTKNIIEYYKSKDWNI